MTGVRATPEKRARRSGAAADGGRSGASALAAYLPRTLVDEVASGAGRGSPLWGRWLEGSLMHCDLSGFTAMSESLAHTGKEGAELMTGVLNRFFERMLAIADRWDGVQMKFGGDSMLLYFGGGGHASRAVACGDEMQRAMREFSTVTVRETAYRLRMRAGVHSGRFFSASVGLPDGALHYLVTGADVSRACVVEEAAAAGKVAASDETAALLPAEARRTRRSAGVWSVTSPKPQPPRRRARAAIEASSGILSRYLLSPVAERLSGEGDSTLINEHRRVAVIFVNVLGIAELLERTPEDEAFRQLQTYMSAVMSTASRHGGVLAGSDAADEGAKLIILFGAPVAVEQEEARALRCALELHGRLEESGVALRQRIGVHAGLAFAGEIGSSRRREYSVIGDNVNLAARLMAAAKPGETLVSLEAVERAGDEFESQRRRAIRVKGKMAPVAIRRLTGTRTQTQTRRDSPLIGRRAELATMTSAAGRAARGRGRWAHVSGEAGIGKSRLTGELAERLEGQGWRVLTARFQSHTSGTPFGALQAPLRDLFGIRDVDGGQALRRLRDELARLTPDLALFAPLVADVLSLPDEDEDQLASLDAKTRRQRLSETLVSALRASARERPLLLLLEDLHWADSPSLELLRDILAALDAPVLVATTSRQGRLPPGLRGHRPDTRIRLAELDRRDAAALVASAASLGGEDVDAIVSRARGNPLFLQELARSGRSGDAVPETIDEVLMARLDSLPHEERTVLRIASVIGPSFEVAPLRELAADAISVEGLSERLTSLAERGFVVAPQAGEETFAFNHGLVQEVAYETLPFAQRRRLHLSVARWLEGETADAEERPELLLHHFDLGGDRRKTAVYAAHSGDRAASVFASKEAIDYYRRSLEALDDAAGSDRSFVTERIADCIENSGSHSRAARTFVESLEQWRKARRRRPRTVPWRAPPAGRESELCRKAAVSYERNADYDESMRWLEKALSALPRRPGRIGAAVYGALSVSLSRKGNFLEGIGWARRSLETARRSGDRRGIAYARNMLGGSYMDLGVPKQAVRHLRSAVEIYHELGDLIGLASANNNLGMCYHLLGDLSAALYFYKAALDADRRAGDVVDTAIARNNIGEVLLALGRPREALPELEAAADARAVGADASLAGLAQVNMSRAHISLGDLKSAERLLRRGARLLRSVGAEGLLGEATLQLAELRLAQGRPGLACRHCRRAIASARDSEARLLEARAERVLGAALACRGDYKGALEHLRESIRLAERLGAGHEEARALTALEHLHKEHGAGTPAEARQASRRARRLLRTLGADKGATT